MACQRPPYSARSCVRPRFCQLPVSAAFALALALGACGEDDPQDPDAALPADAGSAFEDTGAPTRDGAAPDSGDAQEPDASGADAASDAGRDAQVDAAPVACNTVAPTSCPTPAPSYATDIAPVISRRCLSCHDGTTGQWPLSIYRHLVDWSDQVRAMMLNCTMPPPDSGLTMELAERQLLLDWVRCGVPE